MPVVLDSAGREVMRRRFPLRHGGVAAGVGEAVAWA